MNRSDHLFERLLWASRRMMLVPVVASALMALAALFVATVDVTHVFGIALHYADPGLALTQSAALNSKIVTLIVKAVDGYLLAAILLIFALGLYELFIGRIDVAEQSEVGPQLLRTRSLDDLKDRLAKVVVLILVITFFQQAVELTYPTTRDIVFLAVGILLVGCALYVVHRGDADGH